MVTIIIDMQPHAPIQSRIQNTPIKNPNGFMKSWLRTSKNKKVATRCSDLAENQAISSVSFTPG